MPKEHLDRYQWNTTRQQPRSVLIHDIPYIITADAKDRVQYLEHKSILVKGDTIADILPAKRALSLKKKVDVVYDAGLRSGAVVMPGFINTHSHPPMYLLRSTTLLKNEFATTEQALEVARKIEQAMTLSDLTISAIGDFTEQQKFGTTTVLSHYHTPTATRAAAEQAHIRLIDAVSVASKTDPAANITSAANSFKTYKNPLVTFGVTIHTLERVTLAELVTLRKWMAKHPKVLLTIHCSETVAEVEAVLVKHGCRPVELLERAKLLSPRIVLSHAVNLNVEEIQLIAKRKANVAHLPTSNRWHRSGVFQFGNFVVAGGFPRIGLGTDSVISKSKLDLVGEALQSKLQHQDSHRPASFEEVFQMLTCNGARVVGMEHKIGKVAKGYKADLTFWKLKDRMFMPYAPHHPETLLGNFITHGGYTARDVMINGRFVISGRRHNVVHESQLLADLQQHHEALRQRVKAS